MTFFSIQLASQWGADGRAVLSVDLLDESDGLADGHDVLARYVWSDFPETSTISPFCA
jgi:hypothetical protein